MKRLFVLCLAVLALLAWTMPAYAVEGEKAAKAGTSVKEQKEKKREGKEIKKKEREVKKKTLQEKKEMKKNTVQTGTAEKDSGKAAK